MVRVMRPNVSSALTTMTKRAGRLAGGVGQSVRRARLEGERRLLERQRRNALETLGARVVELVRAGTLPGAAIAPEIADVEVKTTEIDAKSTEISALQSLE